MAFFEKKENINFDNYDLYLHVWFKAESPVVCVFTEKFPDLNDDSLCADAKLFIISNFSWNIYLKESVLPRHSQIINTIIVNLVNLLNHYIFKHNGKSKSYTILKCCLLLTLNQVFQKLILSVFKASHHYL